jgi:hypothetical protein
MGPMQTGEPGIADGDPGDVLRSQAGWPMRTHGAFAGDVTGGERRLWPQRKSEICGHHGVRARQLDPAAGSGAAGSNGASE